MPPYFKPLRRKLGILTLLMACGFMAGRIRSDVLYLQDGIGRSGKTTLDMLPTIWPIPYLSATIFLTLLSAWLLLSKPRVAKSPEK